mmetsp:Transcript_84625/g.171604  ORF Transcript_84625/g.171604 Transcript_84625/m.171604 type:complete len:208 (+) Transcript_84625:623-1246(+)
MKLQVQLCGVQGLFRLHLVRLEGLTEGLTGLVERLCSINPECLQSPLLSCISLEHLRLVSLEHLHGRVQVHYRLNLVRLQSLRAHVDGISEGLRRCILVHVQCLGLCLKRLGRKGLVLLQSQSALVRGHCRRKAKRSTGLIQGRRQRSARHIESCRSLILNGLQRLRLCFMRFRRQVLVLLQRLRGRVERHVRQQFVILQSLHGLID